MSERSIGFALAKKCDALVVMLERLVGVVLVKIHDTLVNARKVVSAKICNAPVDARKVCWVYFG